MSKIVAERKEEVNGSEWLDRAVEEIVGINGSRESKVLFIQQLIPAGLYMVNKMLQEEVKALAGRKYERNGKGYALAPVKLDSQQALLV